MLNIYFGDMPEAVYNTSVYFNYTYEDEWLTLLKRSSRKLISPTSKALMRWKARFWGSSRRKNCLAARKRFC